MRCSSCGEEKILVCSSIIAGNICESCYNQCERYRDCIREDEKQLFAALAQINMTTRVFDRLIKLHKRFLHSPIPKKLKTFNENNNIMFDIQYKIKYKNKPALYRLTNRYSAGGILLIEEIEYKCADGSVSILESIIKPDNSVKNNKVRKIKN